MTQFINNDGLLIDTKEPNELELRGCTSLYIECQEHVEYLTGFIASDKDTFFWCGGLMNSCYDANGTPYLVTELGKLSHAYLTVGNMLVAIIVEPDETRKVYEISHDGFRYLPWNEA